MSFFYIALDQLDDERRESIKSQAIATFGAKAEKLDDFLKLFDKKKEKLKEDDHKGNMAMLHQKL